MAKDLICKKIKSQIMAKVKKIICEFKIIYQVKPVDGTLFVKNRKTKRRCLVFLFWTDRTTQLLKNVISWSK